MKWKLPKSDLTSQDNSKGGLFDFAEQSTHPDHVVARTKSRKGLAQGCDAFLGQKDN